MRRRMRHRPDQDVEGDPAAPTPALTIGSDCSGEAPEPDGSEKPDGSSAAAARLTGTYRFEITLEEAQEADMVDAEDTYPIVTTVVLEDGRLEGGCYGNEGGSYRSTTTGSRSTAQSTTTPPKPPSSRTATEISIYTAARDGPGDAYQCYSQVWTKIG